MSGSMSGRRQQQALPLIGFDSTPWYYEPLMAGSIDGTDLVPHDKAVARAMDSDYKPPQNLDTDPACTLFVGRLSLDTTQSSLEQALSQFGEMRHVRLVRDVITGISRRYAFVEFYEKRSALAALSANITVDGALVVIERERCRTCPGWIPRRLGGGLGGNKESGQLRFGGRIRAFRKPILFAGDEDKVKLIEKRFKVKVDRSGGRSRNRSPDHRHASYRYSERRYSPERRSRGYRRDSPEYSARSRRSPKYRSRSPRR